MGGGPCKQKRSWNEEVSRSQCERLKGVRRVNVGPALEERNETTLGGNMYVNKTVREICMKSWVRMKIFPAKQSVP